MIFIIFVLCELADWSVIIIVYSITSDLKNT